MPHRFPLAVLFALGLLTGGGAALAEGPDLSHLTTTDPLPPAEAAEAFRLPSGLVIEPVATEPNVIDPVAVAFDEFGTMFVVEMRDYPNGPAEGEPPRSRIRRLRDLDGDGVYETANVFADELLFATGLCCWREGLIATVAGEVIYLKDTTGDGIADVRQTWFRGFKEGNPQLRANHPQLGPDGRVYVANGLRGGEIIRVGDHWTTPAPEKPLSISGRDFAFDPITGEFEAVSGNGQFGLTFDQYGNRFVCQNRHPCQQVVFEQEHIRNGLRLPTVLHDVAAAGADSKLYPISKTWTTSNLHANQFTAACGLLINRGSNLGPEYEGNVFTCEPTGNLVHREIMSESGSVFTSKPARDGVEFLATTDPWFRPVNLAHGPDGGLYICDMYRAVIEHPQWMPEELKNRPDLHLGKNHGRIWRIRGEEAATTLAQKLNRDDVDANFDLRTSQFGWIRETAFRLISEETIRVPADNDEESIREAVSNMIAKQPRLSAKEKRKVIQYEVPRNSDRRIGSLIAGWLREEPRPDHWLISAAVALDDEPLTDAVVHLYAEDSFAKLSVTSEWMTASERFAARVAGIDSERLHELLRAVATATDDTERKRLRWALLRGMQFRSKVTDESLFAQLAGTAMAGDEPVETRIEAIRTLALDRSSNVIELLLAIALDEDSTPVRFAALELLAGRAGEEIGTRLLGGLGELGPAEQRARLNVLLSRPEHLAKLLTAFEQDKLPLATLDPTLQKRVLATRDVGLRKRAKALFEANIATDRLAVVADYREQFSFPGDAEAGRLLFTKQCATCHRVGSAGVDVGPDISDSRTRTPDALLTDILHPNRAIDGKYFGYTLLTVEGKTETGIIANETAETVTLKQPGGKLVSFSRNEIELMRNTGQSLMPVGFEKHLSPRQMADLLTYIKNWRYLPENDTGE